MNHHLDARQLPGVRLVGPGQERIGRVGQVLGPADSPEWVRVHVGLLGRGGSLVPLAGAEFADGEIRIPYGKDQIKDAPAVDGTGGRLTPAEEAALYRYYGLAAAYPYAQQQAEARRWTQDPDDRPDVVRQLAGEARTPLQQRPRTTGQTTGQDEPEPSRPPRHAAPAAALDGELERAMLEADLYEAGKLGTLAETSPRRGKHVR